MREEIQGPEQEQSQSAQAQTNRSSEAWPQCEPEAIYRTHGREPRPKIDIKDMQGLPGLRSPCDLRITKHTAQADLSAFASCWANFEKWNARLTRNKALETRLTPKTSKEICYEHCTLGSIS
jgi:hypothetical protein